MKRLPLIALLIAALVGWSSWADSNVGTWIKVKTQTWTTANNLATNAALLTATSGVDLVGGGGVAGVICAESTRTITGGNLRAYVYMPILETATATDPVTYAWFPYAALDVTPSTGNRCAATGDKQSWSGFGRIAWVEDDVTVSGGTTITVTYTRRQGTPVPNK